MTGSLSQTRGRPEPGRELDALIAEKVFGATWRTVNTKPEQAHYAVGEALFSLRHGWPLAEKFKPGSHYGTEMRVTDECPHYSTNITAAWWIVEKLNAKERWPEIQFGPLESGELVWHIGLVNPADVQVYASTAPHAICMAALAALSPADDGGAR